MSNPTDPGAPEAALAGDGAGAGSDAAPARPPSMASRIDALMETLDDRAGYVIDDDLAIAELNGFLCFASESCAFDLLGARKLRELEPGEDVEALVRRRPPERADVERDRVEEEIEPGRALLPVLREAREKERSQLDASSDLTRSGDPALLERIDVARVEAGGGEVEDATAEGDVLYFFTQRYIVGGIASVGIKG